jgi:hypothetical protein
VPTATPVRIKIEQNPGPPTSTHQEHDLEEQHAYDKYCTSQAYSGTLKHIKIEKFLEVKPRTYRTVPGKHTGTLGVALLVSLLELSCESSLGLVFRENYSWYVLY